MTPRPESEPTVGGAYDDLPDGPIRTVLSVPLALPEPGKGAPSKARHARVEATAPRHLRQPSRGLRAEILGTFRIGLLSAAVVLVLATIALMALVWQP